MEKLTKGAYYAVKASVEKLAKAGNIDAQRFLVDLIHLHTKAKSSEAQEVITWLNTMIEAGDAFALTRLADCYMDGYGVEKNETTGRELYLKAADKNEPRAFNQLGRIHFQGEGVSKDYEKAYAYFSKAAEQDYALAQRYLGLLYYKGYGVEKDYDKALYYWNKAAEKGDAKALISLGMACENEEDGRQADPEEAVRYYLKAIANGGTRACFYLNRLANKNT